MTVNGQVLLYAAFLPQKVFLFHLARMHLSKKESAWHTALHASGEEKLQQTFENLPRKIGISTSL